VQEQHTPAEETRNNQPCYGASPSELMAKQKTWRHRASNANEETVGYGSLARTQRKKQGIGGPVRVIGEEAMGSLE
jgi:hypothetical protein